MPKPRSSGRSVSMRAPSRNTPPLVAGNSPARMLSVVDLPQPDGPSSATNSPCSDAEIDVAEHLHPAERTAELVEAQLLERRRRDAP